MNTPKPKRTLVAGHICVDITPVFSAKQKWNLTEVLTPGKLVQVGRPDIQRGGAVPNVGLAMQHFGTSVRLTGKIGRDEFGQLLRRNLEKSACDVQLREVDDAGTSYSVVIAVPGYDRIFLHDPGANDTYCSADLLDETLEDIAHFHFGYPPLMRRFYDDGGEQLQDLFRRVKAKGISTSLDMAAVDPNCPAGKVDWRCILTKVLPLVDFYVPSIEETAYMLDVDRYWKWNERAMGGDVTDVLDLRAEVAPLADELIRLGAKVVLLKCGARGLYYKTADAQAMHSLCQTQGLNPEHWCGLEGFEPSFRPTQVASATGAGDTCIGAFLSAMQQGHLLIDCVRLAAAAGAASVEVLDTLGGMTSLSDLERRIQAGWERTGEAF